MKRITKASAHPSKSLQYEQFVYKVIESRPGLVLFFPAVVSLGTNVVPHENLAVKLKEQLNVQNPKAVAVLERNELPRVDFLSTEDHGSTLFQWMWSVTETEESKEKDDWEAQRMFAFAKHVVRGLCTLANLRHEGFAHQDATCWNFCISGSWIDLETAVVEGFAERGPPAIPCISVWPTFAMTVSGTDSATFLLSIKDQGPPWAKASTFLNKCLKDTVPDLMPGSVRRFHESYMHAAERPLLDASSSARSAHGHLKAEFGGAFVS
tara:strand:- start:22 stop:819 length:798 start_codon:yes stop_codon:yes gene_type:complete